MPELTVAASAVRALMEFAVSKGGTLYRHRAPWRTYS